MKSLALLVVLFLALGTVAQTDFFSPPILVDDNVDFAFKVATADFNDDGAPDVVAAAYTTGQLTLYLNDGAGNLSEGSVFYGPGNSIPNIVTADIDGDNDQDLVANVYGNKVLWFESLGDGTFAEPVEVSSLGEAWQPHGLDVGDMDTDGDLDVLIGNYSGDVIWYENNGSGDFIDLHILTTDVDFLVGVAAADLTGDGAPEVIYGSTTEDAYFWMQNDGFGDFTDPMLLVDGANYAERPVCADLDNDGDLDVICSKGTNNPGFITWMRNEGGGTFSAQSIAHLGVSGAGIDTRTIAVEDMDLDGDMDVLSSSLYINGYTLDGDAAACFWFENLGAGIFEAPVLLPSFDAASGGAGSIVTADLDGDNDPDVITSWRANNYVTIHENLLGNGCMDPSACNYDEASWVDDGSCCYTECGCTDPNSLNYEPGATCDNGSCAYLLTGIVFYDINENGYQSASEYGLPFQEVTLSPSGITLITDDNGEFFAVVGQDEGIATVGSNPVFPYNTTANPIAYSGSESQYLSFGISDEEPDFAICIDLYPSGNGFLCDDWANHNICFRNMGNQIIDGVVALTYDTLFQSHEEVTSIDSVVGNTVYMSYAGLHPGEMFFYDVLLQTPTVDHIGEWVHSSVHITGYYGGDLVANGQQELDMEITCAYDPNDKQAFPLGYGDDHRLLGDTEQEFLIRFQNTGNAPAQDVVVVDTLDVGFDMDSFQIMANSHSMSAVIDPNSREVRFQFFDIQLPDSVANEPGSHGLVSYTIRPLPDLDAETRLENTAYIFFDNNPPIVTNTTWTTVHACANQLDIEISTLENCQGPVLELTSDYVTGLGLNESYLWSSDGLPLGLAAVLELQPLVDFTGMINLAVEDALCLIPAAQPLDIQVSGDNVFCPGDLNCDGVVGSIDMLLFLDGYGCLGPLCYYDFDGSGTVSSDDMLVVLGAFGTVCE